MATAWTEYPPNNALEYGVWRDRDNVIVLIKARDAGKADALQNDLTLAARDVNDAVRKAMEANPDFGYSQTADVNRMVPGGRGLKLRATNSLDKLAGPQAKAQGYGAASVDPEALRKIREMVDGAIGQIVAPTAFVSAAPEVDPQAQGRQKQ